MAQAPKLFVCDHCDQVMELLCGDEEREMTCCGKPMRLLEPNTTEGASEKHLPVATFHGKTIRVRVGDVFHPMDKEHYISMIMLRTAKGLQRVCLKPGDEPMVDFAFTEDDCPNAMYAYCNKHGFWETKI